MNGSSSPVNGSNNLPELKLFVKAGADGVRYGACPICQRLFMILNLRAKEGQLNFKVATANLSKPSDEFRKLSLKRVPALVFPEKDVAMDCVDDILDFLDQTFPPLAIENIENSSRQEEIEAATSSNSVFSKFCFFIKDVSKDPSHLVAELTKLDKYLTSNSPNRFLLGNQLSMLDCELLPQLHHLRVATAQLKSFSIATSLNGFWTYLYNAYNEATFVQSCPSDQEIVLHWADKPETANLSFERHAQLTKEVAVYSFDVPAVATLINIDSP